MDGITGTSFWPVIRPWIKTERYDREGGGSRNPRYRIEIHSNIPDVIVTQALAFEMPCVHCRRSIHPFRRRVPVTRGLGHLYYAACCPLSVEVACSRSRDAADEYKRVVAATPQHNAQGTLL